ncbi:MAG: site-specific integrase [Pelagimonas sp.]
MVKKISKQNLQKLEVGKSITGEGLEVRKTSKGLMFYASTQVHGKRLRDKIGTEQHGMNLTKARVKLKELALSIPENIDLTVAQPNITFSDAAKLYISTSQESGGKNIQQKQQQLTMHLIPFFGKLKIKNISTLSVEKYGHQRLQAGAAVATVNREFATLRHMLNSLSEWGVAETKHIKVKNKSGEKQRVKTFSTEQIAKMLRCAENDHDRYTYFFVLIGFQTAMRHKEILRIRFEDFDFENLTLHIPEAKAGSRVAPIHESLAQVIRDEQRRRGVEAGYLFEADSATGHRTYMKKQFERVLNAAGLSGQGFTPHCMRHTAISITMRSGVSVADAQIISGHKSTQMLLRYTHHNNASVARGVNALASATACNDANAPVKNHAGGDAA